MKQSFLFIIILFAFYNAALSQVKFEQETRIKKKEVPESAIKFIEKFGFKKKIKWYKETNVNSSSIEAKTKFRKRKYSIEFDLNGNLEDLEIQIPSKEIPEKTAVNIFKNFKKNHLRYEVEKIQIQYSGDEESIVQKVIKGIDSKNVKTQYEIVIIAKIDKKFQKLEYLFSEQGDLIKSQKIILKNTDNLEY